LTLFEYGTHYQILKKGEEMTQATLTTHTTADTTVKRNENKISISIKTLNENIKTAQSVGIIAQQNLIQKEHSEK
jgi:CHASE3 domain sensor protein